MSTGVAAPTRIASLDQFRGYTVLGMFFVNFVGSFGAIHWFFKHHNNFCSYADTIMPQFFFAVGFAYRLTFQRRLETGGLGPAYLKVLRRSLGLMLVGFVIYHLSSGVSSWKQLVDLGYWGFPTTADQWNNHGLWALFKKAFAGNRVIQTLVHIGITTIWVMPVIAARSLWLVLFTCFSGLLHVVLSYWFYFEWVDTVEGRSRGIDGGPLGFLTWTIPLLVGSLACDALAGGRKGSAVAKFLVWGAVLMGLGYGLTCLGFPPKLENRKATSAEERTGKLSELGVHVAPCPFVKPDRPKDMFTMNQRAGSISYLTFGAGVSLFLYAFFVLVSDIWQFSPEPPPRLSFLGGLMLLIAWLLLLLGSAGVLGSLYGLFGPGLPTNPIPGDAGYIQWTNDYLNEMTSDRWTLAVVYCLLVALAGWEIRRLLRRKTTCIGSLFRTLGVNALAGYIIHGLVDNAIKGEGFSPGYAPNDSPLWYTLLAFGVFLGICYLFLRYMEKNRLFLRL